jgi:integrase
MPVVIERFKVDEPNDLPLVMAQLQTLGEHDDDVWTTAEVAEATGRDVHVVRLACKGRGDIPPVFPNAYRYAPWGTSTYMIPRKDLETKRARQMFPLLRPLKQIVEPKNYVMNLATRFTILTLVRRGMSADLKWDYIHERAGLITYPKEAHKEGEQLNDEYNILLTPAVQDILDEARAFQTKHNIVSEFVFVHGQTRTGLDVRRDEQVSANMVYETFKRVLTRIPEAEKPQGTIHKVRHAFVEWAVDRNDWPPTVADVALGHKIVGIRNRTYFRNIRQREQIRELMNDWQKFLMRVDPATVTAIPWRSEATATPENKYRKSWQPRLVPKQAERE